MSKAQKDVFSSWPEAQHPWERVHMDFFHYSGKTFLLLVDAFTRWVEVRHMTNTESTKVEGELKLIFEMFGDPGTLVADNGPPFNSRSFREFLRERGIKYLNSPPYHPQSNGLAERHVRIVKSYLKKILVAEEMGQLGKRLDHIINDFLYTFRNTPGPSDSLSPAQKMFAFTPRVGLQKLVPIRVAQNQDQPQHSLLTFREHEIVWYRNNLDPIRKRIRARVLKKINDYLYKVQLGHKIVKAHLISCLNMNFAINCMI